jgi:hypothetical protein
MLSEEKVKNKQRPKPTPLERQAGILDELVSVCASLRRGQHAASEKMNYRSVEQFLTEKAKALRAAKHGRPPK